MIDNNAMNNSIRPERDLSGVFFIFLDSLPSPSLLSPAQGGGMGGDEKF